MIKGTIRPATSSCASGARVTALSRGTSRITKLLRLTTTSTPIERVENISQPTKL